MKYKVLIVDDEYENRNSTGALLERWGYEVETAESGDQGISQLKNALSEFAVVLLDYKMPGKNGATTAREMRTFNEEAIILIYSAYPSEDSILSSMRAGTVDFINKSEDIAYLRKALENACTKYEETTRILKPGVGKTSGEELLKSYKIIGKSEKMINVVMPIPRYKKSKKHVLILGETGAGKELIAHALHDGPEDRFMAVNCASFNNSEFLASELFGHEKGSFTGAYNRKVGIFEAARGGTVFLDEIHCLGDAAQKQLLRTIREKKIRRLGGNEEYSVDFRLVVATKPNIEHLVKDGKFLPDLYYRLKFIVIEVPPLRERPEDIEPLVLHFCQKHFEETGEKKLFRMKTMRLLERYNWPGNVGELEGVVCQLLMKTDKNVIEPKLLDPKFFSADSLNTSQSLTSLEEYYEKEKRIRIVAAVKDSGSIPEAADRLGVGRTTLHTLLTRMGMRGKLLTKS